MKNIISFLILVSINYSSLLSQSEVNKDRELQVEKNYNNEIYAVHPVFDFASISAPKASEVNIGLDSMAGAPTFAPDIDVIVKPVAYKTPLTKAGHKGMIKFDKGTLNPWHAQGGYVYSAENYFTIHASGDYNKWQHTDIADQNIAKASGNLGATYYLTSSLKTSIDLNYTNFKYGLYAHQEAIDEPLLNSNHFQTMGVQLGIQTFKTKPAKWNAGLTVSADKWNDVANENTENNLGVDTYVKFNASNKLTLKTTPTYNLSQSDVYKNAFFFSNDFQGLLDYKTANLAIGISTAYLSDAWSLWPSTQLNLILTDTDKLKLSSAQNVIINSAQRVSNYNPYAELNTLATLNSDNELVKDFYIDKNASLSYISKRFTDWTINLGASYHLIEGDQNFHLTDDAQVFTIDRVNYNLLQFELGGQYQLLEDAVQVGINVEYNKYSNESTDLLHRPTWKVNPSIQTQFLNKKLELSLTSRINSPQVLAIENAETIESSWRTNISFEAKYKLLKRLNIYLNADNIIDDKYQVWNGYNNFGRNLSAGLLLKF